MIPVTSYAGERIGVLGMGRSGLAAARALAAGGARPVCWDDREDGRAAARAEGFEIADPADAAVAAGLKALIVSPGIPHLFPAPHASIRAAWAAGVAVDNDIGLFLAEIAREAADRLEAAQSELDALMGNPNFDMLGLPWDHPTRDRIRVVCVTGSNGKSTTTALIGHLLQAAGRPVQIGGNIGRGVFDLAPPRAHETYVLELSSYQTELAATLACDVAIQMNLTPDHLDRHGGLGGYAASKSRLLSEGVLRGSGRIVIGVDDDPGRFLHARLIAHPLGAIGVTPISVQRPLRWAEDDRAGVFLEGSELVAWRRGAEAARIDLSGCDGLRGAHNGENACAAYAAAHALGLRTEEIASGFRSFPGLPHRMQRIAEIAGVVFVNDSKATNADAAEKALLSYDRVRWIAGGRAKEGGIESLRPLFGRIAKAYLIGESAAAFAATLGDAPHEISGDLETAVRHASAEAEPGEAVLLAPAAASFDQFPDFEARGRAFETLVAALPRR